MEELPKLDFDGAKKEAVASYEKWYREGGNWNPNHTPKPLSFYDVLNRQHQQAIQQARK